MRHAGERPDRAVRLPLDHFFSFDTESALAAVNLSALVWYA
jgi:hypothetical protein